jgi:predicted nucleic acid-binding protein
MKRVYLDSCIAIYFVEKHPKFSSKIEECLLALDDTDEVCCSPLSRLECLVVPLRNNDLPLIGAFEAFFQTLVVLEMTTECFDLATQLRADHPKLKTPDALHLSTAAVHGCDEFWTNDHRLDGIGNIVVKNTINE